MRLDTIEVMAKNCPMDVFVYIPKEKRFMFIDDKDIFKDKVVLYFEETMDNHFEYICKKTTKLTIVSNYTVTKETVLL